MLYRRMTVASAGPLFDRRPRVSMLETSVPQCKNEIPDCDNLVKVEKYLLFSCYLRCRSVHASYIRQSAGFVPHDACFDHGDEKVSRKAILLERERCNTDQFDPRNSNHQHHNISCQRKVNKGVIEPLDEAILLRRKRFYFVCCLGLDHPNFPKNVSRPLFNIF